MTLSRKFDVVEERQGKRKRREKAEEDGAVQLGRIKGIKGRLVTRIFRFSISTPARGKGKDERGKKKDVEKFAPFPLRSRSSLVPLLLSPAATSAPLQGANVRINRP